MAERDEGFLSRWSRRKRGGGATPVIEARVTPPEAAPAGEPPSAPSPPAVRDGGETGQPTEDGAPPDLPDIESLDKDSDYTGFLNKGVPEQLQKRALRKLWRSNPVFGFRDGLDDYDENFGKYFSAAFTGAVKTAYKVGKGYVSSEEEEAAEVPETAAGEEEAAEAPETAAGEEEAAEAPETAAGEEEAAEAPEAGEQDGGLQGDDRAAEAGSGGEEADGGDEAEDGEPGKRA